MTTEETIARIARAMGMKRSEITEVRSTPDGDMVRTHDGRWTLIHADGSITPAVPAETPSTEAVLSWLADATAEQLAAVGLARVEERAPDEATKKTPRKG